MMKSSLLSLLVMGVLIVLSICHNVPVYGNSPVFEIKKIETVMPATQSTSSYTVTVTPTLQLSLQPHRQPFISLTAIDKIENSGSTLCFLSEIIFGRTSFKINFEFNVKFIYNSVSWVDTQPIKFYYLLIDSSFPDVYVSAQLDLVDSSTQFVGKLAIGSTLIDLKRWVALENNMINISQKDTKFIFAITQVQVQSSKPNEGYAVNIKFTPKTNVTFAADVLSAYNEKILKLRVSLFIYNLQNMSSYLIRITQNYYVSQNLTTRSEFQYQTYSSWSVYPGMQLVLGLGGFQFANYSKFGFQFLVDTTKNASTLNLGVKNAYNNQISIPKLQATLFSISQLQCPNNEYYINKARTQCYTSCPLGTNAGASNIRTTNLKQCIPYRAVGATSCTNGQFLDPNSQTCKNCKANCDNCTSPTNCTLCSAGYYLATPDKCQVCKTACVSCDSTDCFQCSATFDLVAGKCVCPAGTIFIAKKLVCSSCDPSPISNCIECKNSNTCITCDTGFYVKGGACAACKANCLSCNSTDCLQCEPSFYISASSCIACNQNCLSCNSTDCLQCSPLFYISASSCISCSSNCLICDSTGCLQCDTGFTVLNNASSSPSLVCSTCALAYNIPQCITCDQTQCLSCDSGYFLRTSTGTVNCQTLSSVVCGDGDWVTEIEACDDGNLIENDGCSSTCKVQEDYTCLIVDKLPSGVSFCKYTKDFYLQFFYLEKDVSSNTVHFYFKLQPSSFHSWTQQAVQTLLNPVTFVNSETGNAQIIPVDSLNLLFTKNGDINEVEFIVDYGSSNLEGSFFQFNLQPSLTGLQAISQLSTQNNLQLKVDSQNSAFYLFNYDEKTYDFQKLVQTLGLVIGLIALFMLILGFCIPAGKLIILEALAVVQISYFSFLQFKKIPPTYVGFRNLVYSNGYNVPNLFASVTQSFNDIFKVMGLQTRVLSNENMGFIIFIILPAIIGVIGFIISKFCPKAQNTQHSLSPSIQKAYPPVIEPRITYKTQKKLQTHDITFSKDNSKQVDFSQLMIESIVEQILKLDTRRQINRDESIINQLSDVSEQHNNKAQLSKQKQVNVSLKQVEKDQKLTMTKIIFQRMLFEMTFYGVLVTSYLSWVSIFHFFSHPQITSYIALMFVIFVTVGYAFLFARINQRTVVLNSFLPQEEATSRIYPEKHIIFTLFGEFSHLYTQITLHHQNTSPKPIQKIYFVYILQRIISSAVIVFLPAFIKFTSALLIGIFAIIMVGLVVIYLKAKPVENVNHKKQQVSEFTQLPRQTPRTDLLQKSAVPSQKVRPSIFSFLYENYTLRQGINIFTIFVIQIILIYVNVSMNTSDPSVTFVSNSFIIKIVPILVLGILFINMSFNLFLWVWELKSAKFLVKSKIFFYSMFPSMFEPQLIKMRQTIEKIRQAERQQAQCVKMISNFMEKSTVFQSKQNPFLGIQQKEKQQMDSALLDVFKIEQKNKFQIPFDAKKRKSWLIQTYWDYM